MQQQRIAERNTDDRNCVGDAQQQGPFRVWQAEQAAHGDDEVASMPADHAGSKRDQKPFNRHQAETLSEQHIAQPQGQNGAETVADELKGL